VSNVLTFFRPLFHPFIALSLFVTLSCVQFADVFVIMTLYILHVSVFCLQLLFSHVATNYLRQTQCHIVNTVNTGNSLCHDFAELGGISGASILGL